jgi:pyruvate dehydrogenase E2 component (dihydrolipoamide acetyltransferase)
MAIPVIMPRQGQSVETCIITQWTKKKGETVNAGDILFSYETDKASFDVEAQEEGILLEVFYQDGDEVPVLTNVAVIGKAGEDAEAYRPGNADANAHANIVNGQPQVAIPATATDNDQTYRSAPAVGNRIRISPRAKCMADKLGVNPAGIIGSGPNGRIIVRDIEVMIGQPQGTAVTIAGMDHDDKKISNVRKIIARTMYESISTSAQLTHHLSADVRKLLALRNKIKAETDKGGPNITLNDMVCFTVIRALEKSPDMNCHFLGETIRTFRKIHLGMAVDTPRGLMVPAVQNAGELSLKGLSARLREVADQCRKGNISPELLASTAATFTVSNLGNYGVEMFTPIINLPQVAILGVNTIIYRPADLGNGVFGFIPMIGLSLTYDHRAVDGGPATLFLKEIKNQIENFEEKV